MPFIIAGQAQGAGTVLGYPVWKHLVKIVIVLSKEEARKNNVRDPGAIRHGRRIELRCTRMYIRNDPQDCRQVYPIILSGFLFA